jgi:hypothetical protein
VAKRHKKNHVKFAKDSWTQDQKVHADGNVFLTFKRLGKAIVLADTFDLG